MRDARLVALLALAAAGGGACGSGGSTPRAATPSNTTAAASGAPSTVERECWLGDDRCVMELDLDGDGRADRVESVRRVPCAPAGAAGDDDSGDDDSGDDDSGDGLADPPCEQGLWITLATGATQQVGAGVELAAQPSADEALEPIALGADLGGLRVLATSTKDAPGRIRWSGKTGPGRCDGDGIVLTGSDAAAVLCWTTGTAAAYHLGF